MQNELINHLVKLFTACDSWMLKRGTPEFYHGKGGDKNNEAKQFKNVQGHDYGSTAVMSSR